ncbi:MAG: SPFH domain-containing protein [Planctomycetota bacterium]
MKNIGTIAAAAFLAVVLMLYMCTFEVRYTETAIKKTWGRPAAEAITEPGLKFKWPAPIQTVVKYDQRIRTLEDRTEETRTVDGKNLVLTTFTLWKIKDASKFLTNFPGGEEDGERKLRTTVVTHKLAVIGRRSFDEFVSTDPEKRKLRVIEKEIQDAVAHGVENEYGIEIVGFGIKKLGLPQSVTTAIFNAMKSHEQAKAARYLAEGDARAADILAGARATRDRIIGAAQQKVAEIQSDAQRVVSGYYKEFNQHPELRIFLDKLRTVAEALKERTTLILDTSEAPWDVFDKDAREKVVPGAGTE